MGKKNRMWEELPIVPPLEPRQTTAAELALQEENDQRRIGLYQLKRKYSSVSEHRKRTTSTFSTFLPLRWSSPQSILFE
ncbi:hypothetical protein M378DRAFT_167601 [Amanita muscaria Koide BX008]|uniref:Uncharacterized protein n=1 Tax=Amanita muscaria (strain Koide BX008) TaxID=946122 RepID=A0A0C2WHG7_AMAMK|nr:hypothetical protein M378DRAFT_167601 [Amanita muscaria Koide BX008]